jgi:hypothetical protein
MSLPTTLPPYCGNSISAAFSRASQVNPRKSYIPKNRARGDNTSTTMAKPMSNTASLLGLIPMRSQVSVRFI